jgi:hypothetical protein
MATYTSPYGKSVIRESILRERERERERESGRTEHRTWFREDL